MNPIPKPKYCGQDWLEMTPSRNGRICLAFSKEVVDFRKYSWLQIEQKQKENNNAICGLYRPKQIENWGKEVPPIDYSKFILKAGLLFSLTSSLSTFGQENSKPKNTNRTIIYGTILGKYENGKIEKLVGSTVYLKNTIYGTITGVNGDYKLDITDYKDTLHNPTLRIALIGFKAQEIKLDSSKTGMIKFDTNLAYEDNAINYYISYNSSIKDRIKNKFKKWFRMPHRK
jgi:hypothetical protein